MPRWGDEPVTLVKGDNLYSALAKLEAPGDGLPVVIIAAGCRIADDVVTYRLLARAGKRIGAPIAVVTSNPHWRRLAREQGLHAYPSLAALRRARTRSLFSLPERFADALLSSLHPAIFWQSWPITAVLVLMLAAVVCFVVPVMSITFKAPLENVSRDVSVKVDIGTAAVDTASATIPGRVIEHRFSITDYVETTGQKDVGREKAKGEVTLSNSGPTAISVPAGTLVTTASGIRFSTTGTVTVRASSSSPVAIVATPGTGVVQPATAKVGVVALDAGTQGNLPSRAIVRVEGDAFKTLSVANDLPLFGGTSAKSRTASAEDGARLKELLFQKAQSQSLSELTLRVRQSESLIPPSMQVTIESEEHDRAQDEEGDRIKGTAYVLAKIMCFATQDLNTVAEGEWKKVPQKGYSPVQGALQLSTPEVLDAGARTANLRVIASGLAEPIVDGSRLSDMVRGLSTVEAKAKLASVNGPFKLMDVAVWPAWAPRAFRVEVHTVQ
ncbi:MAG TPA: baseplate J/gp47 family protein [Chloroflexota bacterium]|nr:baseplate J/gp47 family protein [Chloroflexota bacterium]